MKKSLLTLTALSVSALILSGCGGSKPASEEQQEPEIKESVNELSEKALKLEEENHELKKEIFELKRQLGLPQD